MKEIGQQDTAYLNRGILRSDRPMNGANFDESVQELAESHQEEQPCSKIAIGKPEALIFITAVRAGLLSLRKHFLVAALSPLSERSSQTPTLQIDESHRHILDSENDVTIGFIQHEAVMPVPAVVNQQRIDESIKHEKIPIFGCAIFSIVVIALLVTGITTWVRFFFG